MKNKNASVLVISNGKDITVKEFHTYDDAVLERKEFIFRTASKEPKEWECILEEDQTTFYNKKTNERYLIKIHILKGLVPDTEFIDDICE